MQTCPSTQLIAKDLANKGAATGTLVLSDRQTNGIGRNNRVWQSSSDLNLYMSLVLRPKSFKQAMKMNLGAGVAVVRTLRSFGVRSAAVKWPNDVWVDNKKLCGVMVDSDVDFLVLSVGVNLNEDMTCCSDEKVSRTSTSVRMCSGGTEVPLMKLFQTSVFVRCCSTNIIYLPKELSKDFLKVECESFLAILCVELERIMKMELEEVLQTFRGMDLLSGKNVLVMPSRIENPDQYYNAFAEGIVDDGRMKVIVNDKPQLLSAEEISIR